MGLATRECKLAFCVAFSYVHPLPEPASRHWKTSQCLHLDGIYESIVGRRLVFGPFGLSNERNLLGPGFHADPDRLSGLSRDFSVLRIV